MLRCRPLYASLKDVASSSNERTHYGPDVGYCDKSVLVDIFTYYYHTHDINDVVGPCSLEELQSLYANGDIHDSTPLWTSGQEKYEPLARLPIAYSVVPDFLYRDTPSSSSLPPDLLALYGDSTLSSDSAGASSSVSPSLDYMRVERSVLQAIKGRFIALAASYTFCGPSLLLSVNPLMERNAVREVDLHPSNFLAHISPSAT